MPRSSSSTKLFPQQRKPKMENSYSKFAHPLSDSSPVNASSTGQNAPMKGSRNNSELRTQDRSTNFEPGSNYRKEGTESSTGNIAASSNTCTK